MFSARDAGFAILEAAQPYGDLVETKSNAVWSDPVRSAELVAGMLAAGWQPGWPYCAAFGEFVVRKAYLVLGAPPEVVDLIAAKFTPHVLTTYRNCGTHAQARVPTWGSLAFMRYGKTASGHLFMVTFPGTVTVSTIEGNTARALQVAAAQDRNGDGIFKKLRAVDFTPTAGLHLLGFFNPLGYDDAMRLAEATPGA